VSENDTELCEITSRHERVDVMDPEALNFVPAASVSRIEKLKVPDAVGVPLICGLEKVSPGAGCPRSIQLCKERRRRPR